VAARSNSISSICSSGDGSVTGAVDVGVVEAERAAGADSGSRSRATSIPIKSKTSAETRMRRVRVIAREL
jgi:hypothetical protein